MKKTSTFQNGLIWFGAGVSLAEILTGTSFAPLGMAKGFAAILIGHIIGCAMMLLAGLIGGRTGRSAMETVKMSFGQKGGLLFAFLNVLQLVGWTAIMIYDGALAVGGIFAIGRWVWCLVIGALIVGQSAVEAKGLSPMVIIVVAMAGIAGYAQPSQELGAAIRLWRVALVLGAVVLGLYGVMAGLMLLLWQLCDTENLGVSYLSPLTDSRPGSLRRAFLRSPLRKEDRK